MTHPDMKSTLLAAAEDFAFAPKDSAERKACPVASGVLAYFPDALVLVSRLSRIGNDKHNPGQPLHWAKEKSGDEPDALVRHLLDHLRGEPIDRDVEELGALAHLTQVAWRALALLQRACDAERAAAAKREAPSVDSEDRDAAWRAWERTVTEASSGESVNIDEHSGVPPITRESFLVAYVDANPYRQCEHARTSWEVLHDRAVISNEIDEDPS